MARKKKLSDRQELLLGVVTEKTRGGSYFHPNGDRWYYAYASVEVGYIMGAADAAALRGLETRGLIKHESGTHSRYAFSVTEDGRIEYERIAAVRGWPK